MNTPFDTLTKDVQARTQELAYLMWESAGRQQGMAMQYWLAAEQAVLSALQAANEAFLPSEATASNQGSAHAAAPAADEKPNDSPWAEPASAILKPNGAPPVSAEPAVKSVAAVPQRSTRTTAAAKSPVATKTAISRKTPRSGSEKSARN
jgi:hypothetical protein